MAIRSKHSGNMMYLAVLAALSIGALANTSASADILALYNFGTVASPTYSSADLDANSTATVFTPATGLGSTGNWNSTNNGINTGNGNPAPEFAIKPIAKTQEQAFTDNAYWSFTLVPENGYKVNLTSLAFDLSVANTLRPISYYVATSIDGFDSPVEAPVVAATGSAYATKTISLLGLQFQELASPIEVRVYTYADLSGASGSRWGFDNVTLNGTTAVIPEPASLMLTLAGLVLIRRRRSA